MPCRAHAQSHSCHLRHCIFVLEDGTLWTSGDNIDGLLGTGDLDGTSLATQEFRRDSDWLHPAASVGASFAIKTDGTLWSWGSNFYGELGQGESIDSLLFPQQIGTDMDWISVHAGRSSVFALKSDNTLWAWGDNSNGQLGLGTIDTTYTPAQVGTDNDWAIVRTGGGGTHPATRWPSKTMGLFGSGGETVAARLVPVPARDNTEPEMTGYP